MNYCTIKEMAERWGVSEQLVRRYCRQGRIENLKQVDGIWFIPEKTRRPQSNATIELEENLPARMKRILYQLARNNHYGIYEFLQINLAYSSCRMASNRLTRYQIEEVYRTGKVSTAFEPMKIDDLLEIVNHFRCVRGHARSCYAATDGAADQTTSQHPDHGYDSRLHGQMHPRHFPHRRKPTGPPATGDKQIHNRTCAYLRAFLTQPGTAPALPYCLREAPPFRRLQRPPGPHPPP